MVDVPQRDVAPSGADEPGPRGAGSPLRLGILIDSLEQPAWIADALRRSFCGNVATPVLVIRNAAPSPPERRHSRLRAWIRNRRYLAYAAYTRFDRWKFRVRKDPFELVNLEELLRGVPILDIAPRRTKFSDSLEDADQNGFDPSGSTLLCAWVSGSFAENHSHLIQVGAFTGDNRRYRGGPAGFWEVMERSPVTGAILQVLNETLDDGDVLARFWGQTDRFSVARNRSLYYWQAAPLLSRKLRDLGRSVSAGPLTPVERSTEPSAYSAPLYGAPTNAQMVRAGWGLAARYLSSQIKSALTREQWVLGYHQGPSDSLSADQPCLAGHRFKLLIPPPDRFWADPFPIRVQGRDFVFFEEFVAREGKAHISVVEMGAQGPCGAPTRALTCDYHLSYPFVFAHHGSLYMIPETAARRRVELWRVKEFPDQWEFDRVLLDAPLVDATLEFINGRWWMFAAGADAGIDEWDELYLYHASDPTGPWTPHPSNPVVTDVRSARPAGRLFRRGDSWYRPAQDGSRSYGGAITVQKVVTLDETSFEEHAVTRLDPLWQPNLVGIHTINATAGLTVIDARRRRWLWDHNASRDTVPARISP
jgi:hypothetical protein